MDHTLLAITKALADENRVRIVCALRSGELCVCQIVEMLALAPSTVSKHLEILRHARLIQNRKNGRWMYYRICSDDAPEIVRRTLHWLLDVTTRDKQVHDDARRLNEILKLDPEALCCGQREGKRIPIRKDAKQ